MFFEDIVNSIKYNSSKQKLEDKQVVVIGAGLSGLTTAALLGKSGIKVKVIEKLDQVGGRASVHRAKGFKFDLGPSWYMMPTEFDHLFELLGKSRKDYFNLERLDPAYKVFFDDGEQVTVFPEFERNQQEFERLETGAGEELANYLQETKEKYEISLARFLQPEYKNPFEFLNWTVLTKGLRLGLLGKYHNRVKHSFKSPYLQKVLEYMSLFLGGSPYNTPAVYTLINWADFGLGIWYPTGGMDKLPKALRSIAEEYGVEFYLDEEVVGFEFAKDSVTVVNTDKSQYSADSIVNTADLAYFDTEIMPEKFRVKSVQAWDQATLAPSAQLFYLGFSRKFPKLPHHSLFLLNNWQQGFEDIFGDDPKWSQNVNFYVSVASRTDNSVAPAGHENMMILIPAAPGIESDPEIVEHYFEQVMTRITEVVGVDPRQYLLYRYDFAQQDFRERYNAYKGNGFGLANTLLQTAIFRPKITHPLLDNLYFAGQFVLPGTGMPIVIKSGEMAASRVIRDLLKSDE